MGVCPVGGLKRKRDLAVWADSVEGEFSHGHVGTVEEGSGQVSLGQLDPSNRHVLGGTHQGLGRVDDPPVRLDRAKREPDRVHVNPLDPISDRLAGRLALEGGGELVTGATSQLDLGETGDIQTSWANEASDWLEARNTLARRVPRPNQGEPTEANDLEPPTAGVTIDERQLTHEDFWSLLRDAGYETW